MMVRSELGEYMCVVASVASFAVEVGRSVVVRPEKSWSKSSEKS